MKTVIAYSIDSKVKELLDLAATLTGKTRSFILGEALKKECTRILREHKQSLIKKLNEM